ncbi:MULTISPECIES: response regulator transcription factor [unclassified Lentimonas]|uniref:helix-turn-helix transcriptional regulator n=1 Tax=unclassified Lentimonas TaxID=2630993 RepID=UPI00132C3FD0|nr:MULTISPECIES: response regulator transcription factor [unclassified Lentimonas]CAA6692363.1 Unannotated [Lentimonas sp. CC10]CAA6694700.1 Unannotated [Lentimonas sp. CC19]CAA7071445.1 Unannotated [Lentimonas sp. CC11]
MDIRPIYAGELPRSRRQVFPVQSLGQASAKQERVTHVFDTFNFSFIFEGGGTYLDTDGMHTVEAPCVLTQWPGASNDYGPTAPWGSWNEMFVIYDVRLQGSLLSSFRLPSQRRFWKMERPQQVRELYLQLVELTHREDAASQIDRIDLICESMILESLPSREVVLDPALQQVEVVREKVDADFLGLDNVDQLAAEYGFSRSVFRRLWGELCAMPPAHYLMDLKLKYACRLLVETTLPIGEIAQRVGFNDPLYFSRKFRQAFELTATAYRKKFGVPGQLGRLD